MLPGAVLARLLRGSSIGDFEAHLVDRAVLLAGLALRFLAALRSDYESARKVELPEFPPPPVKLGLLQGQQIVGRQFVLAPVDRRRLPLMLTATHRFLASLPESFAEDAVTWAPPVVLRPKQANAQVPVVGNLIPAFVASRVLPDRPVGVVTLTRRWRVRPSLSDLASVPLDPLDRLCAAQRDRLIAAAPSIEVAQLFTGLARAMVARVRQRSRGLSAP